MPRLPALGCLPSVLRTFDTRRPGMALFRVRFPPAHASYTPVGRRCTRRRPGRDRLQQGFRLESGRLAGPTSDRVDRMSTSDYRRRGSGLASWYSQPMGMGTATRPRLSGRYSMNAKMKVLSLALIGLCGYAGSALAACPAGPAIAQGGAWFAAPVGGGTSAISIVTPGYDGTACKLQVSLGNNGLAHAQVQDNSPNNEVRYRAQFIFDPTNLSGANGTNQAPIFTANAAAVHSGTLSLVKITFAGSGGGSTSAGKRLFIAAVDQGAVGGFANAVVPLPTQSGPNRIEIDLQVGAAGTGQLRYWVNDAATTGLSDSSPTGTIALTGGNTGWVGVKNVFLGLTSPTVNYRAVNTDLNAWFDQFDSRRQTFIGH
jgi:hypothetical protein